MFTKVSLKLIVISFQNALWTKRQMLHQSPWLFFIPEEKSFTSKICELIDKAKTVYNRGIAYFIQAGFLWAMKIPKCTWAMSLLAIASKTPQI